MDNVQKAGIVGVLAVIAVLGVLMITTVPWYAITYEESSIRLLDFDDTYSEELVDDFLYGREVTFTGRVMNDGNGKSGIVSVVITLFDETNTIQLDQFTTTTNPAVLEPGEEGSFIKIVNERDISDDWGYYTIEVSDTQ